MNVLIADDDPVVRLELKSLLATLGHSGVGEADTGPKAVIVARNLRPDVVIANCDLPLLSGLDVCQVLTDELLAPTLLLCRKATFDSLDRLDRCGAMGVLFYPFRGSDLTPLLEIARGRWRRIVELTAEVQSLNERMEARKLVGRAKAILMEKFGLQERDAFRRIQVQSATLNKPVHEIARAIITAHDISAA